MIPREQIERQLEQNKRTIERAEREMERIDRTIRESEANSKRSREILRRAGFLRGTGQLTAGGIEPRA